MSYVLQLIIYDGLPLDVELDLMEGGVWVESEVVRQILIVVRGQLDAQGPREKFPDLSKLFSTLNLTLGLNSLSWQKATSCIRSFLKASDSAFRINLCLSLAQKVHGFPMLPLLLLELLCNSLRQWLLL